MHLPNTQAYNKHVVLSKTVNTACIQISYHAIRALSSEIFHHCKLYKYANYSRNLFLKACKYRQLYLVNFMDIILIPFNVLFIPKF